MQDLVSIVGKLLLFGFELMPPDEREFAYIIVGAPPGSDCFDKSKSESIMWPDWWRRMSREDH